jgi:hypothetical protein
MKSEHWNPVIRLCQEYLEARRMIEELQYGLITPAAWEKKYKDFYFDRDVGVYVDDVLTAEETYTPPPHLQLVPKDRGED